MHRWIVAALLLAVFGTSCAPVATECTAATTRAAAVALFQMFNDRRLDDLVESFAGDGGRSAPRVAYFRADEPVRGEFQAEGRDQIRALFMDRLGSGVTLTIRDLETFDRPLGGGHVVLQERKPDGSERTLDGKFQYSCEQHGFVSLLLTPLP